MLRSGHRYSWMFDRTYSPITRRHLLTAASLLLANPFRALRAAQSSTPPRRMLQLNSYPLDAETPLDLLTSYLTPNDLFFVRSHWTPARVNATDWALTIDGA